jgi:lipoate-protein ligase A
MNTVPSFPGHLLKNDGLFLIGAIKAKPWVFAYAQEHVEVVHGPSCTIDREIYRDRCEDDGVAILGRRGGGGTVVLMPGVVVTVLVGERNRTAEGGGGEIHETFDRIHDAMIGALVPLVGTEIVRTGVSDLGVRDKKILGSSLYLGRNPDLYYYQSSLMVDCDLSLIERYLRHPPKEPDYRRGRSHAEFCTALAREGATVTVAEVARLLSSELPRRLARR